MKKWKAILVLGLVFGAGILVGVGGTRLVITGIIHRVAKNPDLIRIRLEQDLDRKLRLDATQKLKVHEEMLEAHRKLKDLRVEFQPQFAQIMGSARSNITAVLTPEQREKFEQLTKKSLFGLAELNSTPPTRP